MKLTVRVTPEADADIGQAFDWYEQAQQGLGTRFLEAVREAATLVGDNPEMFASVHADIRRVLLHVFPYSLFYVIEEDAVVVLGCFHGRRNPQAWKNRGREYRRYK